MSLEILPVLIEGANSYIGLVALVTACFVMVACKYIVDDVRKAQERAAAQRVQDQDRQANTDALLHARISSLETKAADVFQTRRECVTQHEHINGELKEFKAQQKEFAAELKTQTNQIISALQKDRK